MATTTEQETDHAPVESGSVDNTDKDTNDVQSGQTTTGPAAACGDVDMNKVANIIKKSMIGVMTCICCCFPLINAVNIVAIIFAFEEFERGSCPDEDICGVDCQPDLFMSFQHFLLIAGAGSMALGLINMLASAVFIRAFTETIDMGVSEGSQTKKFKEQAQSVKKIQDMMRFCATLPTLILTLGWAVFGIIQYDAVNGDCRGTGQAKMLLAWCILSIFSACSSCNQVAKPHDVDAAFTKLFATANAENDNL